MINNLNADILADIMAKVRIDKGITQKEMAKKLHRSIGTIQNWENGYSCPSVMDMLYWFDALGVNPLKYILEFVHPDAFNTVSDSTSLKNSLELYITNIATESELKKLAYCIYGGTGSSWHSQVDMMCALNHLPICDRINIAENIYNLYEIREFKKELRGTDSAPPNLKELRSAIDLCRKSVLENKEDYSN